jgi:hypothetical protein
MATSLVASHVSDGQWSGQTSGGHAAANASDAEGTADSGLDTGVRRKLPIPVWCSCRTVGEGGRIAETGSPAELMAGGGTYAQLFALQAKAYLPERR